METRTCQNCKENFDIQPEDFTFYEKIKVPSPTFCPQCRLQRRMAWRNDWHLFKKTDALTGEKIFSLFPEESPVKIYDREYWWTDSWNPLDYGRDYDFSKPFFEQFKELLHTVPLPSNFMFNMVDCNYCTNANDCKKCYLVRGASYVEDSAYLVWDQASKRSFDSHMTNSCELGYGNVNVANSYRTLFSVDSDNCIDVVLSTDCVGCTSCFGCAGLRNKSYMIFNTQYTKEEYEAKLKGFNLGSHAAFEKIRERAYAFWKTVPHKYMHGLKNADVSGDYIYESKNTHHSFRVRGVEDSKYIQNILTGPVRDCYDYSNYGDNTELIYECLVVGSGGSNIKFSTQAYPNVKNLTYTVSCNNGSSDLYGCVSLRGKQYCILNKQYTKEEYETLVPKIIDHMKSTGEYGEFFPASLSPFPYQITAAYEFFPMKDNEAQEKGFSAYPIKNQGYTITLRNEEIPDTIHAASDDIQNAVIECAHKENCAQECTGAYRIIKEELTYCREANIPLPRLCPNCRHYERLELRNPPRFYHRSCMCDKTSHFHGTQRCAAEFETSYAPEREEAVYCEPCYQAEIV